MKGTTVIRVRIEVLAPLGDVEASVYEGDTLGIDDLETTLNEAVDIIRRAYNLK